MAELNSIQMKDQPVNLSKQWALCAIALVFCAAVFLFRLQDVGSNPRGFFCDEASIAFNARSIAETGRDEHGKAFPVFFKAFGEYKPGLYIYATALSLQFFDDVHFATRFPAALSMALCMGVVFLLLSYHVHPACGLLGIFILAHEPWINHFSHIAFGLTTIPFLLTTALLLFTIAIHKGTLPPLLLATGVYCLAIYSYPPVRLFVPLFGAGLLLIYWRKILNKPGMFRNFLIAGVFFAILMGPLLYYLLQIEDFMNRFEYLGIFTTPHIGKSSGYKWLSTIFREDFLDKQSLFTRGLVAIAHYASYYSPDYLFSHADRNLRFGSSDYGVLASYDSIGLILGLITLSLRRNSFDKILLLGFILYPIPASLTWEDIPHTGRAIAGHPLVNLIVTLGFWQLLVVIWKANWPKTARCSTLFLTLLAIGYASLSHAQEYYHFHRTKFSHHSSGVMQYGFKEMMEYIEMNHKKYEQVHIVSTFLHYQPYIFALLYSDTDPAKWQAQQKLPWGIEKIFTHSLPQDQFQKNTLYMISPPLKTLPQGVALLKTYHWEDHSSEAFAFYEYTGGSETFEKDWS